MNVKHKGTGAIIQAMLKVSAKQLKELSIVSSNNKLEKAYEYLTCCIAEIEDAVMEIK